MLQELRAYDAQLLRVARYMYGTYFDHVFGAEVFTDLFLQLQGPLQHRPASAIQHGLLFQGQIHDVLSVKDWDGICAPSDQ